MPTANEALLDAVVRHQTYLMRHAGSLNKDIQAILAATEDDLRALIRDRLSDLPDFSGAAALRRAEGLLANIDALRDGSWAAVQDYMSSSLEALAVAEPRFIAGILVTVSPVVLEPALPAVQQLRAIASSKPFHGALLSEWMAGVAAEDKRRIHGAIQIGMTEGEGVERIVRRVIGTNALNNADGTLAMTRRSVEAVVRTAVAHVAADARDLFAKENAEVIDAEVFTATLDSRTTPVCRANDGKRFKLGIGPRPPLHIRCRSLRVPVLAANLDGVQRPFKPVTERMLVREFADDKGLPSSVKTRADLPRGTKGAFDTFAAKRTRELVGQVPAETTYQQWLKRQPRAFQDEVLGIAKAKLFRDGGLTLDKFVALDGSELTLAQLASKYASAFRAAGLKAGDFL